MKSSRDMSWRQKNANKHLPDELRERFISKPRIGRIKRRYEFRHGSWGDFVRFFTVSFLVFYFFGSLPAAIFWTFLVDDSKFTYRERSMFITRIMRDGTRGSSPLYIKRRAYGTIDGKREEVGLPPKLNHVKVGDRLKVAYCPERADGAFCGWRFRVLPMCSFENRKAYARNFLYAVWGPLALIGMAHLIKKTIAAKRRIKCEECVRADPLTERPEK